MPLLDGVVVHPDGQRPALHQRLVIFFPVADVVFGLTHLLCPVIAPGDQNTTWLNSSLICATRPSKPYSKHLKINRKLKNQQ
ncbi:hypothetical protein [Aeromonas hydrophila]|uniref:hypothetical protein n=1 Tax=Aeromonas hydrophila TaxID=644 RepID=UPI00158D6C81|nr:hypothetical protein [Aeromonas hydrophila]